MYIPKFAIAFTVVPTLVCVCVYRNAYSWSWDVLLFSAMSRTSFYAGKVDSFLMEITELGVIEV